MGNRAVIAFDGSGPKAQSVYVHWNGGRASVLGFLKAAKKVKAKSMKDLFKIIQGYLGSSAYLEPFGKADQDNWDNGTYLINRKWEIVDRKFKRHPEEVAPEKTEVIYQDCLSAYYGYKTTDEDLAILKKVSKFFGPALDGNNYYTTLNI
jgi:hypothetical protein